MLNLITKILHDDNAYIFFIKLQKECSMYNKELSRRTQPRSSLYFESYTYILSYLVIKSHCAENTNIN